MAASSTQSFVTYTATPWNGCYYSHFVDEETEVERRQMCYSIALADKTPDSRLIRALSEPETHVFLPCQTASSSSSLYLSEQWVGQLCVDHNTAQMGCRDGHHLLLNFYSGCYVDSLGWEHLVPWHPLTSIAQNKTRASLISQALLVRLNSSTIRLAISSSPP